jgi:hypothetical protein
MSLEMIANPGHYLPNTPETWENLRHELLKIAEKDLREVRAQLSVWHVGRDALFRRTERVAGQSARPLVGPGGPQGRARRILGADLGALAVPAPEHRVLAGRLQHGLRIRGAGR